MSRKTKRFKRKLLVPFEWFGIGVALCVIPWLPRRGLFAFCDFLSALMYVFDRRGKRRALETLRIIRGTCTGLEGTFDFDPDKADYRPTRVERLIIRRSYRNSARSVGYAFWTCVRAKARCAATGEMDARAREFLAAQRPAITVSGHLGCWEILSQLAFLEGHRMMSVAKDIGTHGMTALLMRARRSIGQEIVPAAGAFRPLMQGLKDGRYRCEFLAEHAPEEARDIRGLTQKIADELAAVIRRHPSCWILNYNYYSNKPEKGKTK